MSAEIQPDTDKSVRMAEHILNNFDIPAGFVRDGATDEITEWSAIADLTGKRYFFKTEGVRLKSRYLAVGAPVFGR